MNKKPIIYALAGVAVIVVVGAIAWGVTGRDSQEKGSGNTTSLAALFAQGKNQRCTFSQESNGAASEGTLYFGAGQMRGDFSVSSNGQESKSYMVSDGEMAYLWSDGMPQGVKIPFATLASRTDAQAERIDLNQELDYSCSDWTAEEAAFRLPEGITFIELNPAAQ